MMKTGFGWKRKRISQYNLAQEKQSRKLKDKAVKSITGLRNMFQIEKMEEEIFESCIVLKNLAKVYENMPMTQDFILEQLMDSARLLKGVYADILTELRGGGGSKCFDALFKAVPAKSAKAFATILKKLDVLNPAQMIEQMNSFEETFSDERITRGMKKAERGSMITTLSATVSVFAILLNFTTVVVFMDALNMIKELI